MKKQIKPTTAIIVVMIVIIVVVALFFVFTKGKAPRGGGESMPQHISPFGKMESQGQPPEGAKSGELPSQATQEGGPQ